MNKEEMKNHVIPHFLEVTKTSEDDITLTIDQETNAETFTVNSDTVRRKHIVVVDLLNHVITDIMNYIKFNDDQVTHDEMIYRVRENCENLQESIELHLKRLENDPNSKEPSWVAPLVTATLQSIDSKIISIQQMYGVSYDDIHIILAHDGPNNGVMKRKIYDKYKSNRKENVSRKIIEDYLYSKNYLMISYLIKDVVSELYNEKIFEDKSSRKTVIYSQDDLEADDVIHTVSYFASKFVNSVDGSPYFVQHIVSEDKDILRTLVFSPNNYIFVHKILSDKMINRSTFIDHHNIDPISHELWILLYGDRSNNIYPLILSDEYVLDDELHAKKDQLCKDIIKYNIHLDNFKVWLNCFEENGFGVVDQLPVHDFVKNAIEEGREGFSEEDYVNVYSETIFTIMENSKTFNDNTNDIISVLQLYKGIDLKDYSEDIVSLYPSQESNIYDNEDT